MQILQHLDWVGESQFKKNIFWLFDEILESAVCYLNGKHLRIRNFLLDLAGI